MPRRREFDNVGDGITGHILWSVAVLGFPHKSSRATTYVFDLTTGKVEPQSKRLAKHASEYRDDFTRHLEARALPRDWVKSAILTIEFGERTRNDESLARYRVEVLDDLGKVHTSTRRSGVWHPAGRSLLGALRLSLRQWKSKRH